jgi:ribosomal protein S18 acetylase RimI-like enzyme
MVRLVPMVATEFGPFLDQLIRSYAEENIRAGLWSEEEGLVEARKQIQALLPAGRETPNHFFLTILSDAAEEKVGAIWFAVEPRGGFVYDLLILEPFRRRGYAEQAMVLLERIAREKGARKLLLQVFGDNEGARKLYSKLGYAERAIAMSKTLAP